MKKKRWKVKHIIFGMAGIGVLLAVGWLGYTYFSGNAEMKQLAHNLTGKGEEMQPLEENEVRLELDDVAELKPVTDYADIYNVVQRYDNRYEGRCIPPDLDVITTVNAQKNTVAEQGDVVATDGKYVCRIRENASKKVDIAEIKDGKLIKGKTLDGNIPKELYVRDGILILCSSVYMGTGARDYTNIQFYDITNPKKPKLIEQRSQTGYYCTSQIKNGYMYIVSYDAPYGYYEKEDAKTYVPRIDYEAMEVDRIYQREGSVESSYVVMTAIDLNTPEKYADSCAVWANATETSISSNAIYFSNYACTLNEDYTDEYTELVRCQIENGVIKPVAMTKLRGNVVRTGSFGEYDNRICVITSKEFQKLTNVYVLDEQLKQLASVKKIKGYVKSTAYTEDKAYVATNDGKGRLYTIQVTGNMEPGLVATADIPGAPDYMNVYNDRLLFGVGVAAPSDGVGDGLKIAMYDVSDAEHVQVADEILFESDEEDNVLVAHKEVLFDRERNLIGIATDVTGPRPELLENGIAENSHRKTTVKDGEYHVDYLLLSYDEKTGFNSCLTIPLHAGACDTRGVLSENILCVAALDNKAMFTYAIDSKQYLDRLVKK